MHRGGSVEKVELDEEYEQVAVRAAQIMGLKVAGVDMLEGKKGPLVMEVNSSPGLEGIEAATKLDVAGAIIDYIDNQVAFPHIDVRERLSVSTGYGVAEIVVHGDADLVGKPLGESGLSERDITVLTLHRGVQVIPNPRPRHVLEDGDRLLCWGKLEEMRSMIPERPKRRSRVKRLPKQPIHDGADRALRRDRHSSIGEIVSPVSARQALTCRCQHPDRADERRLRRRRLGTATLGHARRRYGGAGLVRDDGARTGVPDPGAAPPRRDDARPGRAGRRGADGRPDVHPGRVGPGGRPAR